MPQRRKRQRLKTGQVWVGRQRSRVKYLRLPVVLLWLLGLSQLPVFALPALILIGLALWATVSLWRYLSPQLIAERATLIRDGDEFRPWGWRWRTS